MARARLNSMDAAKSIIADLRVGKYAPVYFLEGGEPFFIDQISDYIEQNALDDTEKGFNQVIQYGKDIDCMTVVNQASQFPMMAQRRVVIIKEAQGVQGLKNKAKSTALKRFVENPIPSTILVICHKNGTIDGRSALGDALKKNTVYLESKKLYDNQVPDWIKMHVKELGYDIDYKAMMMILESVGGGLNNISNEIKKVLVNFENEKQILPDHVQKYIGVSKDYNVFELQKAIAMHDFPKAVKIINYFAQDPSKNPAIQIVSVLFGFISKALVTAQNLQAPDAKIASILRVPPFQVRELKMTAQAYGLGKLTEIVAAFRTADLQLKGVGSASLKESDVLKELIYKIFN